MMVHLHAEFHPLQRFECGKCGAPDGMFPVTIMVGSRFVDGQLCSECEHEHIFGCHDCGTPYPFPLDAVLPDDLWARISPTGNEGGLLCANCILKRLAELDPSPVIVKMTPVWAEDYDG